MSELEALQDKLSALSPDELKKTVAQANEIVGGQLWVPNIGPQTIGYFCEADELFYGGQAGGGKSDLVVGLSIAEHEKSLLLRRIGHQADKLAERAMEILGTRDGWNSQKKILRMGSGKVADYAGCLEEKDKENFKGDPHDLIAFDEIPDFLESQYRFIIGWNRSTTPSQRCRVVATGNPPTTAEGLWVIKYWGPWLDDTHDQYPTPDGVLRWYTTLGGVDTEVPNCDPIPDPDREGKFLIPRSRTFIRSTLEDNPDLADDGKYDSVLAALPERERNAYRLGRFDIGLQDKPMQMIPTDWVRASMERWKKTEGKPPKGVPMCTIAADVAQGGPDNTVIGWRHDGWFSEPIVVPGAETPDGPSIAALIVKYRRHDAKIVIDGGGGYGQSAIDHLRDNDLHPFVFKGAQKSMRSTKDRSMKFTNRRAEAYWRLMEGLDPGQFGGSTIALPPSQILLADLTTPTYELTATGIKMMTKEKVVKLLGRSPDEGDEVVMCWYRGPTALTHAAEWSSESGQVNLGRRREPKVNMGKHYKQRKRS